MISTGQAWADGATLPPATPASIGAIASASIRSFYPQTNDPLLCTGRGHDDTAAIQASINLAAVSMGSNYWTNAVGAVVLPAGFCSVSTLTLPPRISLAGQGIGQTFIEQRSGTTSSLIVVPPEATLYPSNPSQWNKSSIGVIHDMTLNGTTGSGKYIIEYSDATSAAQSVAGWMNNLYIVQSTSDSIYGGAYRNEGIISNSEIVYSNGNGVQLNGNDWQLYNTQIGSSQLDDLLINSGCCTQLANMNIYSAFQNNIHLTSGAGGYLFMDQASVDRAKQHGIFNESNHVTVVLSSVSFGNNGAAANNTYDDVMLSNSGPSFTLINPVFSQNSSYPNVVKYLVEQTGTNKTPVTIVNPSIVAGTTPYATGQYSTLVPIQGSKTVAGGCGLIDATGAGFLSGTSACDLQTIRASATQGAAGKASFAAGENNMASSEGSFVGGISNQSLAYAGTVFGSGNTVPNSANYAMAVGHKSYASGYAEFANAATSLVTAGDSIDRMSIVLSGSTVGAQTVQLTGDGSGTASAVNSIPLMNNQSMSLSCDIVATSTATTDEAAFSLSKVLIRRGGSAASVTIPRGSSIAATAGDASSGATGLSVTLTADTTLGQPAIKATSTSGTWRWTARCSGPAGQ